MPGQSTGTPPSAPHREPGGMYFEDFVVGMELETPARTITSADIGNYCGLTGNFNGVHSDAEFAKTTPFGRPIAHGPMVYAMAEGLQYASGINEGTLLALLQVDRWRIPRPTVPGDTIHMVQRVLETRPTSRPDRGIVRLGREMRNQRGECVMEMETTLMYKRRPGA